MRSTLDRLTIARITTVHRQAFFIKLARGRGCRHRVRPQWRSLWLLAGVLGANPTLATVLALFPVSEWNYR
jgi:hypothetical protein